MKADNSKFLTELCEKINKLDGCKMSFSESSMKIRFPEPSGISFEYNFEKDSSKPEFLFFIKADRFIFDGDKTDLNDVFALIVATYLKCFKYDSSMVIRNVSDNIMGLNTEVDYSILIPYQINPVLVYNKNSADWVNAIEELIYGLFNLQFVFWKVMGCPCDKCIKEANLDSVLEYKLPKVLNEKIKSAKINGTKESHLSRKHPTWDYFNNFSKGISLVKSVELVKLLDVLIANSKHRIFKSDNCIFFLTDNIKNIIPNSSIKVAHKILQEMDGTKFEEVKLLPFENTFLAFGKEFILLKVCNIGFDKYREHKEKIRKRYIEESKFLFPPSQFVWSIKIDADRFESLVMELLRRERFTKWIRKAGATNESDNGRDLIAEIVDITKVSYDKKGTGIFESEVRKVVVQCKAYSKSIGKSEVSDIRDTIEFHKSDGFFLVVSTIVTNSLIRHLELLKEKHGYFIDWWTRDEIELRLKQHEDILVKYSDILKPKGFSVS